MCVFAVVITDQETDWLVPLGESAGEEITRLLSDELSVGLAGRRHRMELSGGELDEEEHVEPSQEHRLDGKEVTGDDSGRLGT
jgi:hypothetical protein